jgi:hypothetical protein
MKTISAALAQHLAGEVTTLATLWKVQRRDGEIFGFTDHDRDLVYDDGAGDGPITYAARSGYTRTAIQSTADLAVDNLDVETFFDAAGITEQDLRAGRWDHAEVQLMLVNRANLGQGHLALRRGFLGEVTITDARRSSRSPGPFSSMPPRSTSSSPSAAGTGRRSPSSSPTISRAMPRARRDRPGSPSPGSRRASCRGWSR